MNSREQGGVKSPAPIAAVIGYGSDKPGVGVCNGLRISELWGGVCKAGCDADRLTHANKHSALLRGLKIRVVLITIPERYDIYGISRYSLRQK